jgi:hypothetical protein
MRLSFVQGILCVGVLTVSCKPREYNESETKSATGDVKTLPYNAYLLWRDGYKKADGTTVQPIHDFPEDYGDKKPDGFQKRLPTVCSMTCTSAITLAMFLRPQQPLEPSLKTVF